MAEPAPTLILVLGDQCSPALASLRGVDPADAVVLMAEVVDECTYVRHHRKKVALVLSAMRHFAADLRAAGWPVDYVGLEDAGNTGSLTGELARAIERHRPARVRLVESGEWRVKEMIDGWAAQFGLPVEVLADDRFLCSTAEFRGWAEAQNGTLRMEPFYRAMRRRTGLLMDGDEPVGGRWNLDRDNRRGPKRGESYPQPLPFQADAVTLEVIELVRRRFGGHFGALDGFYFPVTRAQALDALAHFVEHALPGFGVHQDAMVTGERFLHHAVLSPALNVGLLQPLEVAQAADAAFRAGLVPLNSAEGFIRQVIGWREYVRGMYWLDMPGFGEANALGAHRPLPDFYWTADTDMLCLREAVTSTRDEAYAHHIERLMVLGNFAMLAGIDPRAVSDWFLVVYADAYEWVELPNVVGMSQYADGGRMASKPYASGGAYINRMSDYCGRCRFDVKQRTGPDACPFNALYWSFLDRHEARLRGNRRMAGPYRALAAMGESERRKCRESAAAFLDTVAPAGPGWARA